MRFRSLTFVQNPSRNLYAPLSAILFLESTFHFSLCGTFCIRIALIVQFLTTTKTYLHLCPLPFEIYGKRNQRIALLAHLTKQAHDLLFVHQKPAGTVRITVEDVALLVGTYVHPEHKQFSVIHATEGILQVDGSLAKRLHLRTGKLKACLESFVHKILVVCFFVLGDDLDHLAHGSPSFRDFGFYSIQYFL